MLILKHFQTTYIFTFLMLFLHTDATFTKFSAGKERKDGAKDEIQTMALVYKFGGKSLVLLQVNCKIFTIKPYIS
jgi:hypothetical protein